MNNKLYITDMLAKYTNRDPFGYIEPEIGIDEYFNGSKGFVT